MKSGTIHRALCTSAAALWLVGVLYVHPQAQASVVLQEGFEDTAFASRGWYDSTGGALTTVEKYSGASSLECRFTVGGTNCPSPGRHLFPASNSVYMAFYIKHSTNWMGSGKPYHPHMFNVVTNIDGTYVGPAYTHLTLYVEENGGEPVVGIQDGMNIDETRIGQNLTAVAEQRAVAGCNGDSDGYGNGDCYPSGAVHWNGKLWRPNSVYFGNTIGSPTYKGDWHLVEAFFQLNTISGGKGAKDGIIRYWYDGTLIMDLRNVVLRTAAHPTMKFNQMLFLPYIGDGSPADQRFWIDDLTLAITRPSPAPVPPNLSSSSLPLAPTNLRIIP